MKFAPIVCESQITWPRSRVGRNEKTEGESARVEGSRTLNHGTRIAESRMHPLANNIVNMNTNTGSRIQI